MKRLKQKQFRILSLFILGVGVPSLLLGYLAFRGVRNDQALLEKEKREELQSLAETITLEIENRISQTEQAFLDLLRGEAEQETPNFMLKMSEFRDHNPLVKEPFFFFNQSGIKIPVAKVRYLSD